MNRKNTVVKGTISQDILARARQANKPCIEDYFKQVHADKPNSLAEIASYYEQTQELPFYYEGNNWAYEAFHYKQYYQYRGIGSKQVQLMQYFTPPKTAERMSYLAENHFDKSKPVVDVCCGTGQLTRPLLKRDFRVYGLDIDSEMIKVCQVDIAPRHPNQAFFKVMDWRTPTFKNSLYNVISNPPYKALEQFIKFLAQYTAPQAVVILLIPQSIWKRTDEPNLTEARTYFDFISSEPMQEPFERADITCDIVIVKRNAKLFQSVTL
jgi:2-polyprenyl-3-methyl-5-hydroxy-6-metoxy-1,4-benzoquinol methylase